MTRANVEKRMALGIEALQTRPLSTYLRRCRSEYGERSLFMEIL